MNSDFSDFMSGAGSPPSRISDRIFEVVRRDLHPSPWLVFAKLSGIHFITGLFTLSLCPQFGVRLYGNGMGLMRFFMSLGDTGCGIACGFLFLGVSALLASLLLSPEQVRAIRRYRVLGLGALSFLTLGFFLMLHAEIVLAFAAAWVLGSWIGGMLTLELGWVLRRRAYSS